MHKCSLDEFMNEIKRVSTYEGMSITFAFFMQISEKSGEPKLTEVSTSTRGAPTFHFEQVEEGKTKCFELLKETVSKTGIRVRCSNRRTCSARFFLPVVGHKLKIIENGKKLELFGDKDEIEKVSNYGKLTHSHTKRCQGESVIIFSV